MEQLIDKIDSEKNNRFKKTWPRLDKGTKLNRITLYISRIEKENNLNENQVEQLRILLLQLFNLGILNKNKEVNYDSEECAILEIKNLKFNEKTNQYVFEKELKKLKSSSSKSKSNIERHFNRSKKNNLNN